LILHYEDQSLELYNLSEDLSESQNLAKKHPDKTKELYRQLSNWLQETQANLPIDKATGKPIELKATAGDF